MKPTLLQQRIFQFLVHSFLYYQLGESLISDQQYDRLCKDLNTSLASSSEQTGSNAIPYLNLVQKLGPEASGFSIKKYPPAIISIAIHLIYQENYARRISFADFVARHGYRFELVSPSPASLS